MAKVSIAPTGKVGEDTYARILQTTAWAIARDGIKGMRMSHVAAEAGVSNALLHYYFASREELVSLAFDAFYARESDRFRQRLAGVTHPVTRLRAELLMSLEDHPDNRLDWMLWLEVARDAMHDERSRALYQEKQRIWVEDVMGQIQAAKDTKVVPASVDTRSAALRLMAPMEGFGWYVLLGQVEWSEAVACIDQAFMSELGTVGPPPPKGVVHP
jgi:AcrR family transcriptional regulator